jgi:hypothetical protein
MCINLSCIIFELCLQFFFKPLQPPVEVMSKTAIVLETLHS